jgi:XTP/dITP diphosphohydrolase
MTLYAATGNPGKLAELQMAAPPGITIEPLPGLKQIAAPEETGATFEENASLKANYYSTLAPGSLLFADDSGLEVDALHGAPGVHSARFSGPGATDATNNALLQARLTGIANRTARFVCVIALARNGQTLAHFRGTVEGHILTEPLGRGGFGYDPYFHSPALGCTLAQATPDQKHRISHRGAALRQLFAFLLTTFATPTAS